MNIGIIGAGNLGGTLARLLSEKGHRVAISNSRGPGTLAELAAQLGPNAQASTIEEAEAFGEVVLLAIPFGSYASIPASPLSGKVVIDAMNYYPARDGQMDQIDGGGLTSSEIVAGHLPGARLVKAFNTMNFKTLAKAGNPATPMADRLALFLAGDDPGANAAVSRLIEEIGFAPVDTGPLREGGRRQQPGSAIYNRPITPREAEEALSSPS